MTTPSASNFASRFMRPLFYGSTIAGLNWLVFSMPAESRLTAFGYLLLAGLLLFFYRGVVDKGQLTEWLRIWKGRNNAED